MRNTTMASATWFCGLGPLGWKLLIFSDFCAIFGGALEMTSSDIFAVSPSPLEYQRKLSKNGIFMCFGNFQAIIYSGKYSWCDLLRCILPTSCPPTIWANFSGILLKPSILEADGILGACCRKAMAPPEAMDFSFSPGLTRLSQFSRFGSFGSAGSHGFRKKVEVYYADAEELVRRSSQRFSASFWAFWIQGGEKPTEHAGQNFP